MSTAMDSESSHTGSATDLSPLSERHTEQTMDVRDYVSFYLPSPVTTDWNEVFAAPDFYQQGQVAGKVHGMRELVFRRIYSCFKMSTFYLLALVTGVFLVPLFGIIFGLMDFFTVCVIQPFLKICFVFVRWWAGPLRVTLRTVLDPFYQSMGLALSYIRVAVNVDMRGLDLSGTGKAVQHM